MCDYSLDMSQSRLAEDGEQLVLHRFGTGTLGFVSLRDLDHPLGSPNRSGFWAALKERLLCQTTDKAPAICIPPGTRLFLTDVPPKAQKSLQIGPSEMVVFRELPNPSHAYRDALQLPNGTHVLLQDLAEGIHAFVLSTSLDSDAESEIDELEKAYRR